MEAGGRGGRTPAFIDSPKGHDPGRFRLGAGDGTRTRDALLGRQVLYQLSYSRVANERTHRLTIAYHIGLHQGACGRRLLSTQARIGAAPPLPTPRRAASGARDERTRCAPERGIERGLAGAGRQAEQHDRVAQRVEAIAGLSFDLGQPPSP
jgi:hypothetical protein